MQRRLCLVFIPSVVPPRWLTIRLGDTFRFYVYHNERHVQLAQFVLYPSIMRILKLLAKDMEVPKRLVLLIQNILYLHKNKDTW